MVAIAIVAGLVALASLVLLVVIERRLKTLVADRMRAETMPPVRAVSPEQALDRRLQVFEHRLDHLLSVLERVGGRLDVGVVTPSRPSPIAVEGSRPIDGSASVPAVSPPTSATTTSDVALPVTPVTPTVPDELVPGRGPEPMPAVDADALIADYRALITQPRRADITRWIDQHGGRSCEVGDGDVLQMVDQDAGAPLAMLPLSDALALVVPSGRTVVDFPTSYVDGMTLRLKTRGTFTLEADGATAMRLLSPAIARLADGRWRIERPGRLAGFATA